MAYITDSTQSFTITLTALLEGFGSLEYIHVFNLASEIMYELYVSTGVWNPSMPEAIEGDRVSVHVTAINEGDTSDTLFAEFKSVDVTPDPSAPTLQILFPDPVPIGSRGNLDLSWGFTMPAKNVSITINAGHVE